MLYRFLGPIWVRLPPAVRMWLVRLTQPTFTASAAAVVLNDKREVLLLNHILRPSSGWGLPGGFLDAGEQPETAIHRELKEETGIEIQDVRMLHIRVLGRQIEILFAAQSQQTPQVKSREITELGWFASGYLPEQLPHGQKQIIDRVLAGEI